MFNMESSLMNPGYLPCFTFYDRTLLSYLFYFYFGLSNFRISSRIIGIRISIFGNYYFPAFWFRLTRYTPAKINRAEKTFVHEIVSLPVPMAMMAVSTGWR